jgi:hypothetical protein
MKMDVDFHNYDKVFKDAFSIFNHKVLDFLGMDLPKIERFLETEFTEIETQGNRMDLNFLLEDGSILHLEEEVSLSKNDIIRYAAYDLKLYARYGTTINTVVLCVNKVGKTNTCIDAGSLKYSVRILDMSEKDADYKLYELKQKITDNQEINELEIVFLPLMRSKKEKVELLKEAIELEKQLNVDINIKEKIIAMTLVAADKMVEREQLKNIWEEIKMLKVIEFAREKGIEEGMEKGIEEGMEKGMEEGMEKGMEKGKSDLLLSLLAKKFKKVPEEYQEKIKKLDPVTLNTLAMDIFEINDLKELENYLK